MSVEGVQRTGREFWNELYRYDDCWGEGVLLEGDEEGDLQYRQKNSIGEVCREGPFDCEDGRTFRLGKGMRSNS